MRVLQLLRALIPAVLLASALCTGADRPGQVIDTRFTYMRQEAERMGTIGSPLRATIRFHAPPAEDLLRCLASDGISFTWKNGRPLGSRTVFPVELCFRHLPLLAMMREVAAVQPDWQLQRKPPLDVSRGQVEADSVWLRLDGQGRALTGKGVLIADFDTGVDFFHPMLFFADGDTLNWLDVNGNASFDPGTDAVDKNRNGIADAGEILRYVELPYSPYNTSLVYDANLDFLFNDLNNNGVRDRGTGAGFAESTPTYGEQWFICLDANQNNRLDSGELLVGLRTSKVRAIREVDGTVRRRGIDLILANSDTGPYGGHGTSVAGIAVGGVPGVHRLAGIAPGAEMIVTSISYNSEPRFFTGLAPMMVWAQSEGADIMLYEDGEWVWEYLDGSSNEEQMINELAVAGVAQICPAGNLTGGGMQKTIQVAARDSVTVSFTGGTSNVAWPSLRWIGGEGDLAIGLQINGGPFVMLSGAGSTVKIGGKQVYSLLGTSPRGTSMMMIRISGSTSTVDSLRIVNHTGSPLRAEGMLGDDGMGWGGLARWTAPSEDNTVTWPATADSAIGVGAYKNKSSNTDINSYSGRGTRIDARPCVTVAAPGSTVYSIARSVTYTAFGGTSSAGPHVAGGAALLLQADSTLGNGGVRQAIASGALTDQFTGPVPNSTWGYGKLRILSAVGIVTGVSEEELVSPFVYRLEQNYPNPFNPSTTIVWEMPSQGWVQLKVFDILGREITLLVEGHLEAGRHARTWNAGMTASGVYFYRLAIDGRPVSTKPMTLLR